MTGAVVVTGTTLVVVTPPLLTTVVDELINTIELDAVGLSRLSSSLSSSGLPVAVEVARTVFELVEEEEVRVRVVELLVRLSSESSSSFEESMLVAVVAASAEVEAKLEASMVDVGTTASPPF